MDLFLVFTAIILAALTVAMGVFSGDEPGKAQRKKKEQEQAAGL
jgi:hypothetical protein